MARAAAFVKSCLFFAILRQMAGYDRIYPADIWLSAWQNRRFFAFSKAFFEKMIIFSKNFKK